MLLFHPQVELDGIGRDGDVKLDVRKDGVFSKLPPRALGKFMLTNRIVKRD